MSKVLRASIIWFGREQDIFCDGKCEKAWGINNRPKHQLSSDMDDVEWFADGELEIAPTDPGTYEEGHAKPRSADAFPNKWCVRECERSVAAGPETEIQLPDWLKRRRTNHDLRRNGY